MSSTLPILVGLVSGLFSGLFGRIVEAWWFAPKLIVEFFPDERGFRTEGQWKEGDGEVHEVYIRARVRNVGHHTAQRCRPYLVKIEEVHPSGTTKAPYYDSFVLFWPGRDTEPRDIPPGVNQFFDVVGVLKNRPGWRFSFKENFTSLGELRGYKGTYRFTVLVSGNGVRPAGRQIDVSYNGDWHDMRAVDAGEISLGSHQSNVVQQFVQQVLKLFP